MLPLRALLTRGVRSATRLAGLRNVGAQLTTGRISWQRLALNDETAVLRSGIGAHLSILRSFSGTQAAAEAAAEAAPANSSDNVEFPFEEEAKALRETLEPKNTANGLGTLHSVLALHNATPSQAKMITQLYSDMPVNVVSQRVKMLESKIFANDIDPHKRTLREIYKCPALLRIKEIDRCIGNLRAILTPSASGKQQQFVTAEAVAALEQQIIEAAAKEPAILTIDAARLKTKVDTMALLLYNNTAAARKMMLAQPDLLLARFDSTVPDRMDLLAELLSLANREVVELVSKLPRLLSPSLRLNRLLRLIVLRQPYLPRPAITVTANAPPGRTTEADLLSWLTSDVDSSKDGAQSDATSRVSRIASAIRVISFQLTNRDFEQLFPCAPNLEDLASLLPPPSSSRKPKEVRQSEKHAAKASSGATSPSAAPKQRSYADAFATALRKAVEAQPTFSSSVEIKPQLAKELEQYAWQVLTGEIPFERVILREEDENDLAALLEKEAREDEDDAYYRRLEGAGLTEAELAEKLLGEPVRDGTEAEEKLVEDEVKSSPPLDAPLGLEDPDELPSTQRLLHRDKAATRAERNRLLNRLNIVDRKTGPGDSSGEVERRHPVGPGGKKAKPWQSTDEFGREYPDPSESHPQIPTPYPEPKQPVHVNKELL